MLRFKIFIPLIAVAILTYAGAFAHPGKTDSQGGHYSKKTGKYHTHNKSTPPTKTADSERDSKVNDYFRQYNENVGALSCKQTVYARNVDEGTKNRIKQRDGGKCALCGNTKHLEVDHRRALVNGGTNEDSNLLTLCDKCHKIKTKNDNSLRRKRETICKKK